MNANALTREAIETMPAGREMDALVAELMGGPTANVQWYWWKNSTPSLQVDPPIYAGPEFSTDIAAAMMVAEKHPHYFSLVRSNDTGWIYAPIGPVVWRCRFYAPKVYEATADTPSLAICRAALLATLP